MDFNLCREFYKTHLIESIEKECNFSEKLAMEIVEDIVDSSDPAYVCNNVEELLAALDEMSITDKE